MAAKLNETPSTSNEKDQDWSKPAAMVIPKGGFLAERFASNPAISAFVPPMASVR
jgi:hypothetical protein